MTEGKIHLRPRYHRWHVDPGVEWVESNTSHAHLQWTLERRHCALVLLDVWNQHYLKDTQARAEGIVQQRLLPLVAASRQAGLPIVHAPSPNQAKEHDQWLQLPGWDEPSWPDDDSWPLLTSDVAKEHMLPINCPRSHGTGNAEPIERVCRFIPTCSL